MLGQLGYPTYPLHFHPITVTVMTHVNQVRFILRIYRRRTSELGKGIGRLHGPLGWAEPTGYRARTSRS